MTRATYDAMAEMIRAAQAPANGEPYPNVVLSNEQRTMLAQRTAKMFKRDNARFDVPRYLLACDVSASMADVLEGHIARR